MLFDRRPGLFGLLVAAQVGLRAARHLLAQAVGDAISGSSGGSSAEDAGIGMGVAEVRRLRILEEENRKLKQLVADLSLDKQMLQDVLRKKP